MAGIADLLKNILGGALTGGPKPEDVLAAAGGAGAVGDMAGGSSMGGSGGSGGIAAMLGGGGMGSTSPDPMMSASGPQPQSAPNPLALAQGGQDPTQNITSTGAPPPITPPSDAGAGGLSGFLSHMVEKAQAVNPDTGMSFIDKLGKFGGQMTDLAGSTRGAAAGFQATGDQRMADARRQQLNDMADQLGMSPREKLIFQANPDKWVEARAKGLEPVNVPGGDTHLNPGDPAYSAPKYGQENGEGFSATPGGMTDLGSLAQSNQQQAQEQVKRAQEAAMQRYHEIMADAAMQNAQSNRIRATKPPAAAAGGGGLPPGYVAR